MQRLREKGFEQHHLDRVNAPIGLDIASEKPAEIAISIMAEILLIKNEGTLTHKKGEK